MPTVGSFAIHVSEEASAFTSMRRFARDYTYQRHSRSMTLVTSMPPNTDMRSSSCCSSSPGASVDVHHDISASVSGFTSAFNVVVHMQHTLAKCVRILLSDIISNVGIDSRMVYHRILNDLQFFALSISRILSCQVVGPQAASCERTDRKLNLTTCTVAPTTPQTGCESYHRTTRPPCLHSTVL